MKPFLSDKEAGEILGLDDESLRGLVRDGLLRQFRDAGKLFYKTEDVQGYRKEHPFQLIDCRDFTTNGETDWKAFQKSRTENGEQCHHCDAPIPHFTGKLTICPDCEDIVKPEELCHSDLVRCPKCCKTFNPGESDYHDLYEDGEHQFRCECGHVSEICTHVSFSFISPPLLANATRQE